MSEAVAKPVLLLAVGSENSAKLITRHLANFFRIVSAVDAESAWDELRQRRAISLVVCDLDLAIDGFGLLERIRGAGEGWLAATPVLLLVGEKHSDAERETAFQSGATDFINLPFASAELTARARLHANLYVQHGPGGAEEMPPLAAVNLLQQLSRQNFFDSRVRQELSFSLRHRTSLSLCRLKLDNIEAIVAGFDKTTALKLVRSVAGIIQQTLRREDTLCYIGNAEFNILYPATNGISATAAIKRILQRVEKCKIGVAGKPIRLTLSASVFSCIASENLEPGQIFARLEASLEQAEAEGGNRILSVTAGEEEPVLSIDRALRLIETGETEQLAAHASELLLAVLPLLEFTGRVLRIDFGSINRILGEQLDSEAGQSKEK